MEQLKTELNFEISEIDLFNLMDEEIVDFSLSVPANAISNNILFFNKENPFFYDGNNRPIIYVTIKKNEFIPQITNFPLEVSEKAYNYIIEKFNVKRNRPSKEKDWNEILKKNRVLKSTPAI